MIQKDSSIYGIKSSMKICVRFLSESWKSLDRKYLILFDMNLMCLDYIDAYVWMMFHVNHLTIISCRSYFTWSKDALYIHTRMPILSIKARPGTNCWMVRQIDISESSPSRTFSMKTPYNCGWMCHLNARPLSFYPQIPHLHALNHRVTCYV